MKKSQYLRLTAVLTVPLLIVGWWMGYKEFLLPRHSVVTCTEYRYSLGCKSIYVKRKDVYGIRYRNKLKGGEVVLGAVLLTSGFSHPVISVEPDFKSVDGETLKYSSIKDGENKVLTLPLESKPYDNCSIYSLENTRGFSGQRLEWSYACLGLEYVSEDFSFKDTETHNKFKEGLEVIRTEKERNKNIARWALLASTLLPLILYFIFSGFLVLLIKATRYVIHGRQS